MTSKTVIAAAALGLSFAISAPANMVMAETLQVMRGAPSAALNVPISRSVVVESDVPFAELSIADPNIADISTLSDRTIYVLGKAPGRTSLTLLGADGRLITNVEVRVAPDISEFKERLGQILPNEEIEVRTANDGIVLSGTVSSIARMDRALDLAQRYAPERVSNLMVVGGNHQVMLKVRFAEMTRSVAKGLTTNFGITALGADLQLSGASIAPFSGAIPGQIAPSGANTGAFGASFTSGDVAVNLLVEALETKGLVRTLAEPNLVAVSGSEATFLAGGEFPIPVVEEDSITIEYRTFGVELDFIPTVIDDDIIKLELETEVSAIDSANAVIQNGFEIPAFSVRRAQTSIEMRDGQSFAIAGLLQDDFRDTANQIPWLGDVPVLGALFRSADYERAQTELVIIITAHLVTPTSGQVLALPTDRVKLPSEKDLFLNGRVAVDERQNRGTPGEVAQQDFNGSYGYVMD